MDPRGFYKKYNVTRVDGKPDDGPFFTLAFNHDPHARVALAAYADSCESENPTLAAELRQALADTEQ